MYGDKKGAWCSKSMVFTFVISHIAPSADPSANVWRGKTRLLLLTASIHTEEGVWMNSESSA